MADGIGLTAGIMAQNILQGALSPLQKIQDAQNVNQQASAGAQVFRQLGNPQAAQFADLLESNPRGALGVAQQFGGMQNLFGTFQQQQREAALQQPGTLAGFSPEEQQQIQALGLQQGLPLVQAQREQQAAQQAASRSQFVRSGDGIAEITPEGQVAFHRPEALPGSQLDLKDQIGVLKFVAGQRDKTLLPLYEQRQGMATAVTSIRQGMMEGNPAAISAGIKSFLQAIDNSVVRESEVAGFNEVLGLFKGWEDQLNKLSGAGQMQLGPAAAEAALGFVDSFNRAIADREQNIEQSGLVRRSGIDPGEIRRDFFFADPTEGLRQPSGAATESIPLPGGGRATPVP